MKRILFTILSLLFALGSSGADVTESDAEIASLVAQIVTTATKESGGSKTAQELSKKLVHLDQRKVVDSVMPLMRHRRTHIRDLASYIIRECSAGVGPQHLEALKEAYLNGDVWLPVTIASLGTPAAIQFLAEEFRKNPQTQGQVDWALTKLGEQAVPHLMSVFERADPVKEQDFYEGLRYVFKEMDGEGRNAIPDLLKIAESKDRDMKLRQQAVLTIGFIGPPSEEVFPQLQILAKQAPNDFHDVVQRSMIASKTESAARVLADKVDRGANPYIIREIALMGAGAQVVGPRVVGWLDHSDWDSRVIAARTLGAIGYKEGRKPLEGVLSSMADWRLAYAAVVSLQQLGMKESLPALERAARSH